MSGGEWLIRQAQLNHSMGGAHVTERITIETTASGTEEPLVNLTEAFILFNYVDGRDLIFPWANIIRAEYRPHPNP